MSSTTAAAASPHQVSDEQRQVVLLLGRAALDEKLASTLRDSVLRGLAGVYFAIARAGLFPPVPAQCDKQSARAFQHFVCLQTIAATSWAGSRFPDGPRQAPPTDDVLSQCAGAMVTSLMATFGWSYVKKLVVELAKLPCVGASLR